MYTKEKTNYLLNPNVIKQQQQQTYAYHTHSCVGAGATAVSIAVADITIAAESPVYETLER